MHQKRIARIAAIQFLYRISLLQSDVKNLFQLEEFVDTHINNDDFYSGMSKSFFRKLISFISDLNSLDTYISGDIVSNLSSMPIVTNCILTSALAELIYGKADIPVIINEYIEITKQFTDYSTAKFVNAVLDRASKTCRKN